MQITLNITLWDLIKSWKYESKSWVHPFIHFNNLVYEIATWKTIKELIQTRKILKWDKIIDYLFQKEKDKIPEVEWKIIELLNKNLRYKEIKSLLFNNIEND